MKAEHRETIIKQLRHPGRKADMLIERHLGFPNGADGCKPYTQNVEAALNLLPQGVFFHCGRFEEGGMFWCDVGFRPQVQGWGDNLAAAVAGAIFAYLTHPDVDQSGSVHTGHQVGAID
ncbi:MAG: hypothetical protein ACYDDO_01390 [Acidiferrobacterales bacterium]